MGHWWVIGGSLVGHWGVIGGSLRGIVLPVINRILGQLPLG